MVSVGLKLFVIRVALGLELPESLVDIGADTVFSLNNFTPQTSDDHGVVLPWVLGFEACERDSI